MTASMKPAMKALKKAAPKASMKAAPKASMKPATKAMKKAACGALLQSSFRPGTRRGSLRRSHHGEKEKTMKRLEEEEAELDKGVPEDAP